MAGTYHMVVSAADLRAILAEVDRLTRELKLAIAHDRQPYPTAEAYERVYEVLRKRTAERDALAAQLAARP